MPFVPTLMSTIFVENELPDAYNSNARPQVRELGLG
jgi:hypothetical protein